MPPEAGAHEVTVGDLVIDHPWARASAGQASNGALYLTITNHGAEADRLIAIETPVAERAELHESAMDANGVMTMRMVEAVDIAPGATVKLEPGELHVMLFGLAAPLRVETMVAATLVFERVGRVAVEVYVEPVGAAEPSHAPAAAP
ncbi:MAG: copper chaperone PCu(A)C [Alphaproteobacteria bacterium]|nr:copper chaperone PCu(A)C [Alphaproteobacteria bacterium]